MLDLPVALAELSVLHCGSICRKHGNPCAQSREPGLLNTLFFQKECIAFYRPRKLGADMVNTWWPCAICMAGNHRILPQTLVSLFFSVNLQNLS